jgi:AcrR family transcriptional regulator
VDSSSAPKVKTDTKSNLIVSALGLFAEHGIDAVSMRTINNAAGTKNASAVHYHFGNKLGIIEAIIGFIRQELDTSRLDALTALEGRVRNGERPCCREILWAAFTPYYRLYTTPEYGRHALRFLARLQIDMSAEIQVILNRDTHQIARRFDALLAGALPNLPDEIRRLRYLYFWTLTVQMFAGSGFLGATSFGDLRADSDAVTLQRRFDYLVGGMEGTVSAESATGATTS